MKLTLFNVDLISAVEEDLELIRYWRNSEKIQRRMEYRETITPEQHRHWFNEISDYHIGSVFMILYENTKIGVIYSKNKEKFSEGGMFIWDDKYLNTMVPVIVSLMYTDISFYLAKSTSLHIKILRDNFTSIAFNTRLGYVLGEHQEKNYNQEYALTKKAYEHSAAKLRKMLVQYYKSDYRIYASIEESDVENGMMDFYKEKIKHLENDLIVIREANE